MEKILNKMLSVQLKIVQPAAHFSRAMELWMNFDSDYDAISMSFKKAQVSEVTFLVAMAKFYSVLAKVVYEERVWRGVINRKIGKGGVKGAWSHKKKKVVSLAAVSDRLSKSRRSSVEAKKLTDSGGRNSKNGRERKSVVVSHSAPGEDDNVDTNGMDVVHLKGGDLKLMREAMDYFAFLTLDCFPN